MSCHDSCYNQHTLQRKTSSQDSPENLQTEKQQRNNFLLTNNFEKYSEPSLIVSVAHNSINPVQPSLVSPDIEIGFCTTGVTSFLPTA